MLTLQRVPWDQVEPNSPISATGAFYGVCPWWLYTQRSMGGYPQPATPQLGLWWPCSKAIVRGVYRRKAKRLHPDRGGDPAAFRALLAEYERFGEPLSLESMSERRRLLVRALLAGQNVTTAAKDVGTTAAWAWRYVAQYLDVWAVLTWEGIDHLALLDDCPAPVQSRLGWCIERLDS